MSSAESTAAPKGGKKGSASGEALKDGSGTQVATVPLPSVEPPPLRHQLKTLRLVIVGLLLAYTVATIIYAFDLAMAVAANNGGSFARFKAIVTGETVTLGSGLQTVAALACIVASLVWQYRATRNTVGLSSDAAVITPRWAVLWWFVPVMFLFKPFIAVAQLWRISAGGASWRSTRTPWRLVVWWILFWLLTILSGFIVAIVSEVPVNQVSLQQAQAQFVIVSGIELAVLLVAGLWAHIVSRITALQHADGFRSLQPAATARAAAVDLATIAPARAMPSLDAAVVVPESERSEAPPETESTEKTWIQRIGRRQRPASPSFSSSGRWRLNPILHRRLPCAA